MAHLAHRQLGNHRARFPDSPLPALPFLPPLPFLFITRPCHLPLPFRTTPPEATAAQSRADHHLVQWRAPALSASRSSASSPPPPRRRSPPPRPRRPPPPPPHPPPRPRKRPPPPPTPPLPPPRRPPPPPPWPQPPLPPPPTPRPPPPRRQNPPPSPPPRRRRRRPRPPRRLPPLRPSPPLPPRPRPPPMCPRPPRPPSPPRSPRRRRPRRRRSPPPRRRSPRLRRPRPSSPRPPPSPRRLRPPQPPTAPTHPAPPAMVSPPTPRQQGGLWQAASWWPRSASSRCSPRRAWGRHRRDARERGHLLHSRAPRHDTTQSYMDAAGAACLSDLAGSHATHPFLRCIFFLVQFFNQAGRGLVCAVPVVPLTSDSTVTPPPPWILSPFLLLLYCPLGLIYLFLYIIVLFHS